MSDVNAEMKETADYAIKSAKNRYNLDLDYSEQSIAALDSILEKMYWGFSSRIDDKGKDGLIYNTAIIWGSYLGEYMRQKWGGSWKLKGTQQVITINNREFSPISFVYQKITGHFNYKLEDYLFETNQIVGPIQKAAKQEQYIQNYSEALEKKIVYPKEKKPLLSRRNIIIAGSIGGFLVVASIIIIVFTSLSMGGLPAFGSGGAVTNTPTNTATELAILIPTETQTIASSPTITPLPTYTAQPSRTPRPSSTPYMSATPLPTFTPTETETPIPTDTAIPYRSPTPTRTHTATPKPPQPTATSVPPTNTQPPPPPPTNTQPPPPSIESCSVNPSTVPAGEPTSLTFTVQFSEAGHSMNVASFNPGLPGQQRCSANAGGDGKASCNGNSGILPYSQEVAVSINTDIGSCTVKYHSPDQ